jgi:hypothetical protein
MEAGLAALLHDAAVLHRLAEFIEEYCKEQERSQRYTDASGEFFRYAEQVSGGIRFKLRDDLERASNFHESIAASRTATLRRNTLTLKNYLRLLHTLIKPAADAHTLSIPAPLIDLVCEHLCRIEGMQDARIVVLLTPHLMYFQRPHSHVKEQAGRVEKLIPNAEFPKRLGFIEIPYSQGPSFFTNLAMYHEIGHFVYEELPTIPAAKSAVAALDSATEDSLTKVRGLEKDPQVRKLAGKIIESWTQEIFCDLLALRLVGPAFSFALVEILNLLGFQSPEAMVRFGQEHPAPACRFAEHVDQLCKDSWWEAISHIQAEQKTFIESLAKIPKTNYKVYDDDLVPKVLIGTFVDSIIPAIRELVQQLAPEAKKAAKIFGETREMIDKCLSVGVVPHANTGSPLDPVSIINSAFCFYLTSLPRVIAQFEGSSAKNDVDKQSKWIKKLEDWTMKAVENSQMRTQFERG